MHKFKYIFSLLCSYDPALRYLYDANIVRCLSSAIRGQGTKGVNMII
jgi:hypothetical protein